MAYLTAAEIAAMKTAADLALPETVTISRASLASDGMGGFTETWATVTTAACRVDPPGTVRLDEWMDKIQNRSAWVLHVPAGTNITGNDQVTSGGVTYQVIGIISRDWEITRQAVVVKL